MKRLTFFSKRKKFYHIKGNSILTDYFAKLLNYKKYDFYYLKEDYHCNYSVFEDFFLPERVAEFLQGKVEKINFTLITEEFILPVTNEKEKFLSRLSVFIKKREINKFEELLKLSKFKKLNFKKYIEKNFSKNFFKIITAIPLIYGYFNIDTLELQKGVQILKDFFSKNYIFNEDFFVKNFIQNRPVSLNDKKVIRLVDSPDVSKIKEFHLEILHINPFLKDLLPKNAIFYLSEPYILKDLKLFNCKDINSFKNLLKSLKYNSDNFVEKKEIKSYKGLISKDRNFLGKYSLEPYNPYDLINSAWRFFNEKEGNE